MRIRGPLKLEVDQIGHEDVVGINLVPHDPGSCTLAQDFGIGDPLQVLDVVVDRLRVIFFRDGIYDIK